MTKVGTVLASTVARLNRWDAPFILKLKDEVEARGASIDTNIEETLFAQADIEYLEKNQQRQRLLPLPGKRQ